MDVKIPENDRVEKFSGNLGHEKSKISTKKLPNPPNLNSNATRKPERFGDILTFFSCSSGLVGQSNFQKVEIPAVDVQDGKKKRRYRIKKKEAELIETSNISIEKYFPRLENSRICKMGKRKQSIDGVVENKKSRVGYQTRD